MRPGQKGPADFYLAVLLAISVKAGRTDDPPIAAIRDGQCASGIQGIGKEFLEHIHVAAILGRMLLPDERVGCHCVQFAEILRPQRPQFHEVTLQYLLSIETDPLPLTSPFEIIPLWLDA